MRSGLGPRASGRGPDGALLVLAAALELVGCKDRPTSVAAPTRATTPAPASTAAPVTGLVSSPSAPSGAPGPVPPPGSVGPYAASGDTRITWFPETATIAARVAALADPALRGRGSATADEAAAADKVAGWFRELGLEPGGASGGYLAPFTWHDLHSQNVIGLVRGTDPAAGHVIIGAHLDHLGVVDGAVHPGADDNASGVAGLCAAAAALAHAGQRPRPTVVFVAFGAEEIGLLGSEAYVAAPALPLTGARFMINLDMIGRARFLAGDAYALAHTVVADDAIGALASPEADDLVALARAGARTVARPLVAASDFGPLERLVRPAIETRGDQASFAAAGVRYLWLSTSMHDDYHLPSDTADKVDPATVAAVARVVVEVVLRVGDPPP